MKKLTVIIFLQLIFITSSLAGEKCKNLVDKPVEWSKCVKDKGIELGKKGSKKLNTDSKLTNWIKEMLGK
tara:strand:+ start:510 stop:719 length:210 start_codon:yes stop_codon:yes gene_type:complete